MSVSEEKYVVDNAGNRSAVLVGVDRYSQLIEAEEELACIREFDTAKASDDKAVPFDLAVKEIEEGR